MSEGKVFVHENALLESDQVGDGTRVWAFAHILPGARIGTDACAGVRGYRSRGDILWCAEPARARSHRLIRLALLRKHERPPGVHRAGVGGVPSSEEQRRPRGRNG